MLRSAAAVAAGGALGALARWTVGLLSIEVARRLPPAWQAWPVGTSLVNALGCLAIGLLAGLLEHRWLAGAEWRAFLLVGVLGGFTTFSSFALEAVQLLQDGRPGLGALYAATSTLGGMVLVAAGWMAGRAV